MVCQRLPGTFREAVLDMDQTSEMGMGDLSVGRKVNRLPKRSMVGLALMRKA